MCGIAGFINFSSHNTEEALIQIRKMASSLVHRGPDEEGFYVDEHAALGHRRLSIIALSSGQQPMASQDENFQIVFNGEIYNFNEIRQELETKNWHFVTASDTEVVLNSYIEWGEECVKKFNGMFAFVIWDKKRKTVFAARDRVGKKPFYYITGSNTFAFASEIKALLACGMSQKKVNPRAMDCYFSLGYIPVPLSIYDDIFKLPPAHTMTITKEGISKKQYWALDFSHPRRSLTMNEAAQELEEILYDAVKLRLISEVPLGAFLSGGIDSTLVVSIMARIMNKPVLTNTIGFDASRFNELPAARSVAGFLKTDHKEFIVQPDAAGTIKKISRFLDEPFADSSTLPTWHVCSMAKKNVTVAISGDGGDEGFGGYTFRYSPHLMESKLRKAIPAFIRTTVFSLTGALYPASSRLPKYLRLKTIFENLSTGNAQAFYNDLIWLRNDIRNKLYTDDFIEQLKGFTPAEMVMPFYLNSNAADPVSKSQDTDIHCYMTDDVLVKVDRMSMAHSLEVRNPLLDHRVLEFAAKLPLHLKLHKGVGKLVLRRLTEGKLPAEIRNLPKQGFSIPAADWLRKDLHDLAMQTINNSQIIKEHIKPDYLSLVWQQHQTKKIDHSVFLWSLMMLGFWEHNFHGEIIN